MVLVITDKLDKAAQNSAWFHALDRCGAHIAIWPLNDQDMPAWLAQRARQRGLSITADALAILQERTEGNLLAAAQELDKLHLLYGNEPINADQLREAVADSARYDVFQLIDAAHRGEALHVVRMLHSLAEEGEGAIAFLNAVLKDLRALVAASEAARQGLPVGEAMLKAGAWQQRLPLLQQTFKRHQSSVFPALLQRASRIDLSVKGMDTLQAEDALENLLLAIAGKKIAA